MILRRWKAIPWVLSSALALVACDGTHQSQSAQKSAAPESPSKAASTEHKVASGKVYRVITEDVKPPLITYVSGKPTGFEYDVLQAIAEKQGLTFEYDITTRVNLLPSIVDGKADIAAGAITITEERAKMVDFSAPVLDYTTAVLVSKKLAGAKSMADLRGKQVASRKGTVYEQMAIDELADAKGDNIRYYDSVWLQVKSVLNGTEEVMLGDSHILEYYIQQHGNEQVAFVKGIPFPKESYGFAIKKGNTELQKSLNEGLAAIKADGTYDKIRQTYWQK